MENGATWSISSDPFRKTPKAVHGRPPGQSCTALREGSRRYRDETIGSGTGSHAAVALFERCSLGIFRLHLLQRCFQRLFLHP